ncbi:MAG: hypothetical protein II615_01980, partial [Ruminococcus sp.]|nr:hypothetical protein [Ruminococcus sp.]
MSFYNKKAGSVWVPTLLFGIFKEKRAAYQTACNHFHLSVSLPTRRLTNGMQPFSSLSLTSDAPSMALSNKQTCPKAPRVPTGTPTGTGTLIAVFFA